MSENDDEKALEYLRGHTDYDVQLVARLDEHGNDTGHTAFVRIPATPAEAGADIMRRKIALITAREFVQGLPAPAAGREYQRHGSTPPDRLSEELRVARFLLGETE